MPNILSGKRRRIDRIKVFILILIIVAALAVIALSIFASRDSQGGRDVARSAWDEISDWLSSDDDSLDGYLFILDPGHGGTDSGTMIGQLEDGRIAIEPAYTMDIVLRVKTLVEDLGGEVVLTTRNPGVDKPLGYGPPDVIPFTRNEIFEFNKERVRAGTAGMEARIAAARQAMQEHPDLKAVFLSIHFDSTSPSIAGTHIIVPAGEMPAIGQALLNVFGDVHRLRTRRFADGSRQSYWPLVMNGRGEDQQDPYTRNLYILREEQNPVDERALIELGNFNNEDDLWKAMTPDVRQAYAQNITDSFVAMARAQQEAQ